MYSTDVTNFLMACNFKSKSVPDAVGADRVFLHLQLFRDRTVAKALPTQFLNPLPLLYTHHFHHLRSQQIGSAVLPLVPETIKRSCQISDAYAHDYFF